LTGFSAEWLALREPADARARSAALAADVSTFWDGRTRIVDLGSGAGANVRYLAPHLGDRQRWLLVDADAALLAANQSQHAILQLDLASALDRLPLEEGCLVTASALLDLVSEDWLRKLAARCREVHAVVLFALTYDGRVEMFPADADDAWIHEQVNQHQLGDKGFGAALGPQAAGRASTLFAQAGYAVRCQPSDWVLEPEEFSLQQQLMEGWAQAATEQLPAEAARCASWLQRRLARVAQGQSRIVVGHQDLLAVPSP